MFRLKVVAPAPNTQQTPVHPVVIQQVVVPCPVQVAPPRPAAAVQSLQEPGVSQILTREALDAMEEEVYRAGAPKRIYLDIETAPVDQDHSPKNGKNHALDPFKAKPVSVQILARDTVYLIRPDLMDYEHSNDPFFFGVLERILIDPVICKVGHNLKFDLKFILRHLLDGRDLGIRNSFDTCVAEFLLTAGRLPSKDTNGNGPLSLAGLCKKYLGKELSKAEQTSFRLGADLTQEQIRYAVEDVRVLPAIMQRQAAAIKEHGLTKTALLEFSILPAVAMIELAGMEVNPRQYYRLLPVLERKKLKVEARIKEMTGDGETDLWGEEHKGHAFNPGSPQQVMDYLKKLGFKVKDSAEKTLKKVDHPFARALLDYRKLSKLVNTYLRPLPRFVHEDGRVRPEFKQIGSDAGRFSCNNPNLQQVPRHNTFRKLFTASEGNLLVVADYGSIEMRVLAEMSQDPALVLAFHTKGQKFFRSLAAHLFEVPVESVTQGQYNDVKTLCYGLNYGQGAAGLAERRGSSTKEAEALISRFFKMFPEIKKTLDRLGRMPAHKGYTETMLGRKRFFSPPDTWAQEKFMERQGRNTPIQGTAGDIFKLGIRYLYEALQPYEARIVNLVHDEFVVECPEARAKAVQAVVKDAMVRAGREFLKSIPVEVETTISKTWRKG